MSPHILPKRAKSGMTLLELTVVILVLMTLVGILFVGAKAWKRGSDRSSCILNVRNCQSAIRGYSNTYGVNPGDPIPSGKSRKQALLDGAYLITFPTCPGGGSYGGQELTTVPALGTLMMTCDWGSPDNNHTPPPNNSW